MPELLNEIARRLRLAAGAAFLAFWATIRPDEVDEIFRDHLDAERRRRRQQWLRSKSPVAPTPPPPFDHPPVRISPAGVSSVRASDVIASRKGREVLERTAKANLTNRKGSSNG